MVIALHSAQYFNHPKLITHQLQFLLLGTYTMHNLGYDLKYTTILIKPLVQPKIYAYAEL